jgi:UPF0176 protein
MARFDVAAFYKFVALPRFAALQEPLRDLCAQHGVKGVLLLAPEGINGTLAGPPDGLKAVLAGIRACPEFADLTHKASHADTMPFLRLKVRLKAEIVTLGEPGVDPCTQVGTYVEPQDWNALISDPDVLVIDTRNHFEVGIGTFKGAIDPDTVKFSEFAAFVRDKLDPARQRQVAMFCTGGIRCEKASSFMLQQGFGEVFHLRGGILNYLEKVPQVDSLWQGSCFVFDERVAVGHGLAIEDIAVCVNCQSPLTDEARASRLFEPGVSCPSCAATLTETQKSSSRERHRQIELARARGQSHLGPRFPDG